MLSTLQVTGIPDAGFRIAAKLADTTWQVPVVLDGESTHAVAYAELVRRSLAPNSIVPSGDETMIAGVIGDDARPDKPSRFADFDVYRLELPSGHFAVSLDVLANRIGSPLDARLLIQDSQGREIAEADDNLFASQFAADPALHVGLDGGVYFIAVSAGSNARTASDAAAQGVAATETGPYLLRIESHLDSERPRIVSLSFHDGETLHRAPTEITVRFSEPINLVGLNQTYGPESQEAATLSNDAGGSIELAATGYDSASNEVRYALLNHPKDGQYTLTLHAAFAGDYAGNRLDGQAANDDFTATFTLNAPTASRMDAEPNDSLDSAAPLDVLYADDLRTIVTVPGKLQHSGNATDVDYFRLEVTADQFVAFRVRDENGSTEFAAVLRLYDEAGNLLSEATPLAGSGINLYRFVHPGEYFVAVSGGDAGYPTGFYQLMIQGVGQPDVPSLTDTNPGPAVQVVLRGGRVALPAPPVAPSDRGHSGQRAGSNSSRAASESPASASGSSDSGASSGSAHSSAAIAASTAVDDHLIVAIHVLPAVDNQPVGTPRSPAAGETEVAIAGRSDVDAGSNANRPPSGGESRHPAAGSGASFSVAGVSGSFSEPLTDTIPHGTFALSPSTHLVSEIAELVHGRATVETVRTYDARSELPLDEESLVAAFELAEGDSASNGSEFAATPQWLVFGVAASIAAGAVSGKNRRRVRQWARHAVEWLSIEPRHAC